MPCVVKSSITSRSKLSSHSLLKIIISFGSKRCCKFSHRWICEKTLSHMYARVLVVLLSNLLSLTVDTFLLRYGSTAKL